MTDETKIKERLTKLAELSMMLSGEPLDVFKSIAKMIGELLDVPVVCLSEVRGDELYFLSVYVNGKVMTDAGHCDLSITPCATVEESKDMRVYEKVVEKFPEASFLKDHNAHSYCGFPALDREGNVVAVSCLLDTKPHEFSEDDKNLLNIFSQRIGVEMERRVIFAEEKERELALKENEKRMEKAQEIAHVGTWDWDIISGELVWSDETYRILGFSPGEVTPSYEIFLELVHPDDKEFLNSSVEAALNEKKPYHIDCRIVRRDGTERMAEAHGEVIFGEEGKPERMLGLFHDITVRKLAEEALRESEEKFRTLLETAPVGIGVTTEDGYLYEANSTLMAMMGYRSKEELMKVPVAAHYKDAEKRDEFVERFAVDGFVKDFEVELMRKDGSVFLAIYNSVIHNEPDGKKVFITTVQDITERKMMAEELLKTQKLESLGVLAGGIAHDFNNLLTGIMGNISLAMYSLDKKSDLHKRLAEAEKASLFAKELTSQLLTFSKGGAPVMETVLVGDIVGEAMGFALRGSGVRCNTLVAEDLMPVEADKGQLSQVINNILINADQSMPGGGVIDVEADGITLGDNVVSGLDAGEYVRIRVEDYGTGIQPNHLSRIFDPYFTTKQKGSGLGLASAYSIVVNHGGMLLVESEVGKGTVFSIYLPASDKEVKEKTVARNVEKGTGRVLVMDDEVIIRELLCEVLKSLGYEVETVSDGEEAIARYKEALNADKPFDAVIMDLTIPGGMGGKEAIVELKKIDEDVKAIVSSGYSNDPIMSDFKDFGFSGVISKPYNIEALSTVLKSVL